MITTRSFITRLIAFLLLFMAGKSSAQSVGSAEVVSGGFGISSGGTTTSVSETIVIGPGTIQIDGTWQLYARYVFIDPTAVITGDGTIQFFNPSIAGGLSSPTYIDGNATLIDVNIEQHNDLNLVLVDADNPFSMVGIANGVASVYVGRNLDFSVANGDIILAEAFTDPGSPNLTGVGNTTATVTDLIFDIDATTTGYGLDRFVVTNNSIQGHIVKESLAGTFEFPLGILEGDYTPAIIENSGTSSAVHVSVQDYASSASIEQVGPIGNGMERTWNIYTDVTNGPVLDIALQHNQVTDQTLFEETSNFVTRFSTIVPNYTGDLALTINAWQSNILGASIPGSIPNSFIRNRVYSDFAADDQDELAFYTKSSCLITPLDMSTIVLTCPPDTLIDCTASTDTLNLGSVFVETCDAIDTIYYADNLVAGCPDTLYRTWYVVTDLGVMDSCVQTITIADTVAPVIAGCPSDLTVPNDEDQCGAIVFWTEPTAQDACSTVQLTSTHTSGSFLPVGTTTVTYTATDECGNQSICSFTVTVEDVQKPDVSVQIAEDFCEGEEVTWQPLISDNCAVNSIQSSHNQGDVFAVGTTVVSYTVTDVHGNDSTYTFEVTVLPLPQVAINASTTNACLNGNLVLTAENPVAGSTYIWYHDLVQVGEGTSYTVSGVTYETAGTYSLAVVNANGCQDTAQIEINVRPCDIIIVEVFSPDGDDINEYFHVENLEAFPRTKVWIYNRWGTEVYHSDDYQNDWDGRSQSQFNVGGDELPEGTYFYLLELGGEESDPNYGKVYKGYVYIKRNI